MSQIDEVADQFVTRAVELDPVLATISGVTGYDDKMPDLSPDGFEARAELDRATLATVSQLTAATERERVAQAAMLERLDVAVATAAAGELTRDINVIGSWLQMSRAVFDLMPVEGEQAQRNLRARLAALPAMYADLAVTYAGAARDGRVSARRQLTECAKQCVAWSTPGSGFYEGLVQRTKATGAMRADLDSAAAAATAATAQFGRFLETELLPLAPERDAIGRDRYVLASRNFLGATVDLDEAYAWAWSEVARIKAEMAEVAGQIVPGGTLADAVAALDADPSRRISGRQNLRAWMQEYADKIISDLHGVHFDIPEPARRIECMIAPTNEGNIYYTGPSEDWSRPGQMWWSVPAGVDDFSTWQQITIIHHEGVPGHHLQIAEAVFRQDTLNRWQRMLCFVSGHGEGWALYSEQLMAELGYLEDPGNRLGLLDSQILRAVRVVLDLGVHLELPIPAGGWHDGEIWNAELAWEFLRSHVQEGEETLRFELNRYLGWPGQAPSYKLGERIWLQAREDARQRKGADFSLKEFHSQALALGSLGLDPFREALARR